MITPSKKQKQLEKAAVYIAHHRSEHPLQRLIMMAAWKFNVDNTDLLHHMRKISGGQK